MMDGMLWASLVLVGVPLAVGIGVLIVILRHRKGRDQPDPR